MQTDQINRVKLYLAKRYKEAETLTLLQAMHELLLCESSIYLYMARKKLRSLSIDDVAHYIVDHT